MSIGIARKAAVLALALGVVAAGCGGDDDSGDAAGAGTTAADTQPSGTLRLGYFPNVTHAPAIIGVEDGLFADALAPTSRWRRVDLQLGTEAIEAILSDSIDATFIGPNPAITPSPSRRRACRSWPAPPRAAPLSSSAGHRPRPNLAGATLATPSARQHPGRRAAGLAGRPGLRRRRDRRRRREITPRRTPTP
jgi:NitT/TauT family transport system substrate-binding protein